MTALRAVNVETGEIPESISFEDFWTLYPRHVAKKLARAAWDRIPDSKHVEILTALVEWRRVWIARGEPDYIPHPTTWLNGERWEDELPKPAKGPMHASHMPAKSTPLPPRGEMPQEIRELIAKIKAGRY